MVLLGHLLLYSITSSKVFLHLRHMQSCSLSKQSTGVHLRHRPSPKACGWFSASNGTRLYNSMSMIKTARNPSTRLRHFHRGGAATKKRKKELAVMWKLNLNILQTGTQKEPFPLADCTFGPFYANNYDCEATRGWTKSYSTCSAISPSSVWIFNDLAIITPWDCDGR